MEENVRAALSYVLGFVTGIVFYLIEKESDFVRFHAMQSIITFLGLTIIYYVVLFAFPFFIGPMLAMLVSLLSLVVWIVCIIKAYQGQYFKLPFVGDIAEQQIRVAT